MAEVDLKTKLTVAPVITEISATEDKKIFLKWEKVPLAEKYDIKRSTAPDAEFVHIDWATGTEFTDETAEADTTYWYKVIAWKRMEAKKASKKASTMKVVVASDIPCAQALSSLQKAEGIHLSWKADKEVTYHIYRRSDFFSRPVFIGESKKGSFVDKKAVSGQVYHYSVQSVKKGKEKNLFGNFTVESTCAFVDTTEILSAKKIWGRATVEARVIAGADGYIFERSNSKDGEFAEVGRTSDITAVSFEEKLPSGFRSYYYRVRAYKKSGEKEFLGAYSAAKAVR